MLDSELERVEAGWLLEERRDSLTTGTVVDGEHHGRLHLAGLGDLR